MRKVIAVTSTLGLVLISNISVCSSDEPKWGTIKGQVRLYGDVPKFPPLVNRPAGGAVCGAMEIPDEKLVVDPATKGIANVVVYLVKKPANVHPSLQKSKVETVTFDQKGGQFVPHVMLVRTDQKIQLLSDAPCTHNVTTYLFKNRQHDLVIKANDRVGTTLPPFELSEKLPGKVGCKIHPWMIAYWLILNHPYAAVTNEKGEFEIPNLPVGQHEFVVWQESAGYLIKKYAVTVAEGLNELEPLEFEAGQIVK